MRVMKTFLRLIWDQPWGPPLFILVGIAAVIGIVWYNVREAKTKEIERKRDRADNGSIWDD